MMNKNERMNALNNAGVDTSKYFNLNLPNGLKPGSTISLVINENGQPVIVSDNYDANNAMHYDCIANQIIEDGYVRNTKLHRRFVMAQMFKMLNYENKWNGESGFHGYLNTCYGYDYTFDMMLEEVKVLSKLEVRDRESFVERSHFFTKEVVYAVMNDYMNKLKIHVDALPEKKCKGIPYKRIKGQNIFVADLQKKLYQPLIWKVNSVRYAKNYGEVYKLLKEFMDNMVRLDWRTAKSKAWIDAFKGEGAYYTLKNLIMFHDCTIFTGPANNITYRRFDGAEAVRYLNRKLDEYQNEGWRMFALMKKVIEDNDFNFKERMEELYADK